MQLKLSIENYQLLTISKIYKINQIRSNENKLATNQDILAI